MLATVCKFLAGSFSAVSKPMFASNHGVVRGVAAVRLLCWGQKRGARAARREETVGVLRPFVYTKRALCNELCGPSFRRLAHATPRRVELRSPVLRVFTFFITRCEALYVSLYPNRSSEGQILQQRLWIRSLHQRNLY